MKTRVAAIRELLVVPLIVVAFMRSVRSARREGKRPVLWSRIPGGVSWKFFIPVLGDPSFILVPIARLMKVAVWASNHDISPEHESDKINQRHAAGTVDRASDTRARRSGRVQSSIQAFALPKATCVTAVSEGTRLELIERYSLDPATTGIVRAGVDPSSYAQWEPWQRPTGRWKLGLLGASADSDIDFLLKTLRGLDPAGFSVTLLGRGFGEMDRSLLPPLPIELRSDVKYADLAAVASSVDVWLVPLGVHGYHRWAWPLKIPMYLASGRPVVMTDHPELASAGVAPYVYSVARDSADGLASGVAAVVADVNASDKAKRAREFALTSLSWDEQFSGGFALLRDALGRADRTPTL
jgi:glycosyltransferase involved in cell wall biosynthesis